MCKIAKWMKWAIRATGTLFSQRSGIDCNVQNGAEEETIGSPFFVFCHKIFIGPFSRMQKWILRKRCSLEWCKGGTFTGCCSFLLKINFENQWIWSRPWNKCNIVNRFGAAGKVRRCCNRIGQNFTVGFCDSCAGTLNVRAFHIATWRLQNEIRGEIFLRILFARVFKYDSRLIHWWCRAEQARMKSKWISKFKLTTQPAQAHTWMHDCAEFNLMEWCSWSIRSLCKKNISIRSWFVNTVWSHL